jgi:uroporphyrinogen decarboxylase
MKLHDRKPDIENLYTVFRGEEPPRPTFFELFMNTPIYERLAERKMPDRGDRELEFLKLSVDAYKAAGFDYATALHASDFEFKTERNTEDRMDTISLNQGFVITDEDSFEKYQWPDAECYDYSRLEKILPFLPEGMKLMVMGPCGVLENVIALTGYDNLCFMLYDNPPLAKAVFDKVGGCLLKYYEISLTYESVGIISSNDDWGFKTQTFLSPEQMREYLFPWHRKIVEAAHKSGRPVILHSCGYFNVVMDDVIEMDFDGKHSYEDVILPVEDSYEKWQGRIGILGGMDMNFLITHNEEDIMKRCRAMLKRAEGRGGYALGTGNSVPEYLPQDHYIALLRAGIEY